MTCGIFIKKRQRSIYHGNNPDQGRELPVGLIRMNAAENVVENGPVSAAHLEGLTLATVHIVSAAHLYSSYRNAKTRSKCFKYALDLVRIFFQVDASEIQVVS